MFKKLAVGLMVVSVLTTGFSFANSDVKNNEENVEISSYEMIDESYTFEDEVNFLKTLDIKLTTEQQKQLRTLFNKAVKAQDESSWKAYEEALQKITGTDVFEEGLELEDNEDELKFLFELIEESDVKLEQNKIDALNQAYKHATSKNTEEAWQAYDKIVEDVYGALDVEEISLEDDLNYLSDLDITIDDTQNNALKEAYNQAVSADNDESWKAYDDLFVSLLGDDFDEDKQMFDFKGITIEDEIDYLTAQGVKLTAAQTSQLKKMFDAAQSDQSEQTWQKYEEYFKSLLSK